MGGLAMFILNKEWLVWDLSAQLVKTYMTIIVVAYYVSIWPLLL